MTVHASAKYVYSTTVITCIESADSTSPTRFTNSLSSTWRMATVLWSHDNQPWVAACIMYSRKGLTNRPLNSCKLVFFLPVMSIVYTTSKGSACCVCNLLCQTCSFCSL